MIDRVCVAVLAVTIVALSNVAIACEDMTVRDAAYVEPRDSHALTLIGDPESAEVSDLERKLADWLVSEASGLNLELQRADPNDSTVDWQATVGIPSPPPTIPVTVLAGRNLTERRTFFVDYWEPVPGTPELEVLSSSPVRESIREKCPKRVGVLLYAPGSDASKTAEVRQTLEEVAAKWRELEPLGVEVLEFDRNDPKERLLVSFFGIPEEGPDWVAVAFGRGKITPPLEGEAINEVNLTEKLSALAAECTCLQTASNYGVDLPMVWGSEHDEGYLPMRAAPEETESPATLAGIDPRTLLPAAGVLAVLVLAVVTASFLLLRRRTETV